LFTENREGLPDTLYWETLQRLSFLHKRQGRYAQAIPLWERAAEHGQLYAYVELAKLFEHMQRNYQEAISWTQQALQWVDKQSFPPYERTYWKRELEHRLERLIRKQAGVESSDSPDE
jgi:tetratricopeptide (TPR) repeat protein